MLTCKVEKPIARLESRLDELTLALAEMGERLARLENYLGLSTESATEPAADIEGATPARRADFTTPVALAGRTLICLAGAYVPRALTGEGLLPQALGVAAGLAYAGLWIFMADRAGGQGQRTSAAFHGVTSAVRKRRSRLLRCRRRQVRHFLFGLQISP